jgi:hypothetical protein
MSKRFIPLLALILLFLGARPARAQTTPREVSFCDLVKDPKSFDGKTIRVRGTLSVYFEDFSLVSKDCKTQQEIWLAFGGDVPGLVPSTVNDNSRNPGADINVNGVSYGIKKDENFRRLYALIAARHGDKPDYRVTATLTGPFFAGRENTSATGEHVYIGYGHLSCCSLFVITQVSDVESVPPANLNVRGTVLGPDGGPLKGFDVVNEVDGGSPPERQQATTDGRGGFEFSDSGQLLWFEDPRYRPVALFMEPGHASVHVKLEDAKRTDWVVPSCEQAGGTAGRIGFSVLFTLPSDTESSLSDDEVRPTYFVFHRGEAMTQAELFISRKIGQPINAPSDPSGWSERRWIKDRTGTVIGIDTRGQELRGKPWRIAIFLGQESASYDLSHSSGERESFLDKAIDSACIAKQ